MGDVSAVEQQLRTLTSDAPEGWQYSLHLASGGGMLFAEAARREDSGAWETKKTKQKKRKITIFLEMVVPYDSSGVQKKEVDVVYRMLLLESCGRMLDMDSRRAWRGVAWRYTLPSWW